MNPPPVASEEGWRRTRIVATLGPATDSPEQIRQLIAAGVDAFRLNFSHSDRRTHAAKAQAIREEARRAGRHVCLLQDLQGPKMRLATFRGGEATLVRGGTFRLTVDDAPGDETRVGLTWPDLVKAVAPGQKILLRDGRIELRIMSVDAAAIATEVVTGGTVGDHAGINVPEAQTVLPGLTAKDVEDLAFGATLDVDWLALSFVRSRQDLLLARRQMERVGSHAKLMAKIEKPAAVERFDEILAEADGVMIARGDLGVELPPEAVPIVQKRIIRACVEAGKPVVTATQMLESMVGSPRPTRAEASDVANAIFDGADAVMLSNETAVGEYPLEAVRMMDRIARSVEASPDYAERMGLTHAHEEPQTADAVAHSACRISEVLRAKAVACYTASGATVWRVARYRPRAMIVALTPFERVARQLALGWGVAPLVTPDPSGLDALAAEAVARLRAAGMIGVCDRIVITAGVPLGKPGTTNLLRVETAR